MAGLVPLPAVYTTAVSVLVTGFVHLFGAAAAGKMPLENREFRFDRAVLCCDPLEFALGCIPTTHLALRVNSPTHTTGVAHGLHALKGIVSILNETHWLVLRACSVGPRDARCGAVLCALSRMNQCCWFRSYLSTRRFVCGAAH